MNTLSIERDRKLQAAQHNEPRRVQILQVYRKGAQGVNRLTASQVLRDCMVAACLASNSHGVHGTSGCERCALGFCHQAASASHPGRSCRSLAEMNGLRDFGSTSSQTHVEECCACMAAPHLENNRSRMATHNDENMTQELESVLSAQTLIWCSRVAFLPNIWFYHVTFPAGQRAREHQNDYCNFRNFGPHTGGTMHHLSIKEN